MDAKSIGELVLVGNYGDLYLFGPKGLFRVQNQKGASVDRVAPVCASAENPDVSLGRVRVDAEGRDVCYEVISPDTGIKGKLLGLFSKKKEGGGPANQAHNLFHYSHTTNQQVSYPSFPVEKSKEEMFIWNISPKFRYLVVAQPEKKAYHLQVIDTLEELVTAEFELPLTPIRGIWINDEGTLLVDVNNGSEQRIFVVHQQNRKAVKDSFVPPKGYEIQAVGSNYISALFPSSRRLVLFKFDGSVLANVELQPLIEMGATPFFNFNERGDIDILLYQDGALYIQHSDPRSILTDAKRWQFTAREQQISHEETYVRNVTEGHEEERRNVEREHASRQLAASMESDNYFFGNVNTPPPAPAYTPPTSLQMSPPAYEPPPAPPKPTMIPASEIISPAGHMVDRPSTEDEAPRRPELPKIGQPRPNPPPVTEAPARPTLPPVARPSAPPMTEPSARPAPPPVTEPVASPIRPSVPPGTEPEPAPLFSTPEPARAPVAPTPKPAPKVEAPVEPLSFLRGAFLPPPNTEDDDDGTPPPPPVRPPAPVTEAPPPAPEPAAPAIPPPPDPDALPIADLIGIDHDAELERLRMLYIAGELSREEYYRKRTQVEEARRHHATSASPEKAAIPKRLNIEIEPLGPPPAGGPSARPTRRIDFDLGGNSEL